MQQLHRLKKKKMLKVGGKLKSEVLEHGVHSGGCVEGGLLQGITTVKGARGRKGINNRLKINMLYHVLTAWLAFLRRIK